MQTRLKELREDNNLTQDFCAKLAYISKNSYIRYENDERMIPFCAIFCNEIKKMTLTNHLFVFYLCCGRHKSPNLVITL